MIGSEIQANIAAFSCGAGARGDAVALEAFVTVFAYKRVIVFSATAAVIDIVVAIGFASIGIFVVAIEVVRLTSHRRRRAGCEIVGFEI